MYLTYSQYQEMGGTLSESQFNRYLAQATAEVDSVTFGRVNEDYIAGQTMDYDSKLKWLLFELVETFSTNSVAQARVTAQSNEGISQQFALLSPVEATNSANRLAKQFLSGAVDRNGVPLLYRGL